VDELAIRRVTGLLARPRVQPVPSTTAAFAARKRRSTQVQAAKLVLAIAGV
jgi:hypothetical protein